MKQAVVTAVGLYLVWGEFQDQCQYWLPAWGMVEGSARLWQPVILGLIGGLFFGTAVWLGYSVLSYLFD